MDWSDWEDEYCAQSDSGFETLGDDLVAFLGRVLPVIRDAYRDSEELCKGIVCEMWEGRLIFFDTKDAELEVREEKVCAQLFFQEGEELESDDVAKELGALLRKAFEHESVAQTRADWPGGPPKVMSYPFDQYELVEHI